MQSLSNILSALLFPSCPALADDFWMRGESGTITHHFKNDRPLVVLCIQGRKATEWKMNLLGR